MSREHCRPSELPSLLAEYANALDQFNAADCLPSIRQANSKGELNPERVIYCLSILLENCPEREFPYEMIREMFPTKKHDRYNVDYGIRAMKIKGDLIITPDIKYKSAKSTT